MVDVITRHQVTTQDKGPTNYVLLLIGVIGEGNEKKNMVMWMSLSKLFEFSLFFYPIHTQICFHY